MREVLGGGSGGRWYADGEDTIHVVPDSRNIPVEFAEARWPFVVERLGLAVDSGGPGRHRGGLGYDKHIRMLRDAHFMSIADRSMLACWGVRGGRAGRPFSVVIDPGGPERAGGRRAGRRRAGPGRRGDPDPHHRRRRLGRPAGRDPYDEVVRDVAGARSRRAAPGPTTASCSPASRRRRPPRTTRARRAPSGPRADRRREPFFDRGPGLRRAGRRRDLRRGGLR